MYCNIGLIGHPVEHSLSPTLHTDFLYNSGVNGGYCCFDVPSADKLGETFEILKKFNFSGVNVTVPYKADVIPHMDELSEEAESVGAVNTINFNNGVTKGFNTDIYGFLKTLELARVDLTDKKILMLGCGGAATAVLYALNNADYRTLDIVNRNQEKCKNSLSLQKISNYTLYDYNYMKQKNKYDVIINTTSIGLKGEPFVDMSNIECCEAAVDLQYSKTETSFLKCFNSDLCRKVDGFTMLVYQAAKAFEIWTGKIINPDEGALRVKGGVQA